MNDERVKKIAKLKLYHNKDLISALRDLTGMHNKLLDNRLCFQMLGMTPSVDEKRFIESKTDIISELLNRGYTISQINNEVAERKDC